MFLTSQRRLRHTGLARVFDYDLYRRTRVCLLCIFAPQRKVRSHFTKLLTRALFFGSCHCSYIFVSCLAFRVHVAGDLMNKRTKWLRIRLSWRNSNKRVSLSFKLGGSRGLRVLHYGCYANGFRFDFQLFFLNLFSGLGVKFRGLVLGKG